ncbi:MAG TPA: biopolymer transporter ExbD, partial [Pirellulaceae bacterium]|nr:biopolymer transporter ExbD [Pirellulaceae bacterium]
MTSGSVRIVCLACGAEVTIHQQALGRKMRCPICQAVITASEGPPPPTAPKSAAAVVQPAEMQPTSASPPPPPRWTTQSEPTPPPLPSQPAAVLDEATPSVKKRAQRAFVDAEMDMTPMVDVVFQLLIFFMLTAAFTIVKSQQFPKPEQTQPATAPVQPEEDPDFVIVRIDAANTYYVSGGELVDEEEAPSPQELLIKLKQARMGTGGQMPTKLLVKAHGDCTHERVVTAIDAGTDVGIEEVKVLTVDEEE